MCHQTVGLIQKVFEENEIICSTISIIDEITIKLKTKRYLSVPYDLGFPLGNPNDYNEQEDNLKIVIENNQLDFKKFINFYGFVAIFEIETMNKILLILSFFSFLLCNFEYTLEDYNPTSPSFGNLVWEPEYLNYITMHYFSTQG